ncbi:MAG: hypothetical protein C0595_04275 [Marinilabiliales bacterium]|nr:MAG: hypothetical protein C0595_04275 [Marinilabiliales bacterium]
MELFDTSSLWFTYGTLPFLIFLSRIIDVSLDTLRIVFISKGDKLIAPILGFFEILIWLMAITRIMQNLDNISCYLAYAGGFAAGNYIGLKIEEKLAMGIQMFRIITQKDASLLIEYLSESGFGATAIEASGINGKVHVIYSVVKRSENMKMIEIINKFNPNAFYSIEDIRKVNEMNPTVGVSKNKIIPRWMRKGR